MLPAVRAKALPAVIEIAPPAVILMPPGALIASAPPGVAEIIAVRAAIWLSSFAIRRSRASLSLAMAASSLSSDHADVGEA